MLIRIIPTDMILVESIPVGNLSVGPSVMMWYKTWTEPKRNTFMCQIRNVHLYKIFFVRALKTKFPSCMLPVPVTFE